VIPARAGAWLDRWRPILPLFLAEFIIWLGFGAVLPVMPLYVTQHGVDLATLGVIVAAWPAARLIGEPIFGWLADRTTRVPLMVIGLVGTALFTFLPLVFTGAPAFLILRALSGFSTAIYDPAARGYVTDAVPPERHGEAFGLYSAAQMGGLLFGPAIGALGASAFGGIGFVFAYGGLAVLVAAVVVAVTVREVPHVPGPARARGSLAEFPGAGPIETVHDEPPSNRPDAPMSLANRRLIAAIAICAGSNFAFGAYEVVWSLYLEWRGAGLELIGLTFAMFGLPVILVSPFAGRLVDRRGSLSFVVVGCVTAAVTGFIYPFIEDPVLVIPVILVEGAGTAFLNPALYAIVAAGSPVGRSSTAQGLFGGAGTVGFIVASIVTGALAAIDLRYPFFLFGFVMLGALAVGLAIGGRSLDRRRATIGA
jgi:DHA1 family multidrug resistance protein-like MFS transporter